MWVVDPVGHEARSAAAAGRARCFGASVSESLDDVLLGLDGRSYGEYRRIGRRPWALEQGTLTLEHVQADPFAAPSRVRIDLPGSVPRLPRAALDSGHARRASADFLQRAVLARLGATPSPQRVVRAGDDSAGAAARRDAGPVAGDAREAPPHGATARPGTPGRPRAASDGGGERLEMAHVGPEVLERTGLVVAPDGSLCVRLCAGLPAAGRRILGRAAGELLVRRLPALLASALDESAIDLPGLLEQVRVIEDQVALRDQLARNGLVAFLAEGAILPRASRVDARPLVGALPLVVPEALAVELDAPHAGRLRGLGIRRGVTLVVGGGYHGKSTLLAALAHAVYDHVPGDGRERCVTVTSAIKVRAEDGRSVRGVDLRPFIGTLPLGRSTQDFGTDDASGSTSQAAAIVEGIEAGATALLIDEDTAATNFMIRDARMRELVPAASEPITPLIDRVRQLASERGVASVIVGGGAGDYLDVADNVIRMDAYQPHDATAAARAVARHQPLAEAARPVAPGPWRLARARIPHPASFDARRGAKAERVRSRRIDAIEIGEQELDLSALEQIVDPGQTHTLGDVLLWLGRELCDGRRSIPELLDAICARLADGLEAVAAPGFGDRATVRRHEIAAALNRLRSLRLV